jgi:hypothetical protein
MIITTADEAFAALIASWKRLVSVLLQSFSPLA